MPYKNKLDVLYFVCCKFYVATTGFCKRLLIDLERIGPRNLMMHYGLIELLGNVVISKNFLRTCKIMVMHSNEGESMIYVPL